MQIVNSSKQDLHAIAKCHEQCFKDSLSCKLGINYIKKTFEWFLIKPNRFLFHIEKEGEIIGYCGGFIPQYVGDGSTSGMMQYAMQQAITGALLHPWLLFNKEVIALYPLILKNIKRKLLGKQQGAALVTPVDRFDKRLGLVVIGVHPSHRGAGVFPLLMSEFEAKAHTFNINRLILSVKKDNARALKAYYRQGWFIIKEHEQTLEMCKHL